MGRNKSEDLKNLEEFIQTLQHFKREKIERWEKIDDKMQSEIRPGTPSEDWIIPPDENITEKKLMEDPTYRELKLKILSLKDRVISISEFIDKEEINNLQWLNFQSPLIGNVILEECIEYCKKLRKECNSLNY